MVSERSRIVPGWRHWNVPVVKWISRQTTNLGFRVRVAAGTQRSRGEMDITSASEAGIASSTLAESTTRSRGVTDSVRGFYPRGAGSIPAASTTALVVQRIERPAPTRKIAGSIPAEGTEVDCAGTAPDGATRLITSCREAMDGFDSLPRNRSDRRSEARLISEAARVQFPPLRP